MLNLTFLLISIFIILIASLFRKNKIKNPIIIGKETNKFISTYTHSGEKYFNNYQLSKKTKVYILMLHYLYNIFENLGIRFFLSSGTLLGFYREGKIIDYDYDIDIGIYSDDFTVDLISKMQDQFFIHYRTFSYKDKITELSFYFINNLIGKKAKIDIFIHYINKNDPTKIYWMSQNIHNNIPITYQVSNFEIKPVLFLNQKVWVPADVKKYLIEHYGPKWHIPIKPSWISRDPNGYKYHTSPHSIVNISY